MDNIIRLGDYITEICEKTTVNNQHMVLTSSQEGIVSQDDYFNKQVASKDNTGYKVIRRGQFTYRAMSDTGRFYINRLCDYDTGIVSPAYPVFELKKNEDILPDYLQEYFHSEQFQNSIALSSTGSTRASLKLAKIADLRIAVPSISDQRHMIIAIQHVSDLISAQNSALCKLDELVKSRFIELFGDPVSNPLGWEKVPLGKRCEIVTGNTPSRAEPENYGEFIEWIKSDNINTPYTFITEAQEYLSETGFKKCRFVEAGSLLMTCIAGSINCIGNVAVTDRRVAFNQQINAIVPEQDEVLYLYWLMLLSKPAIHSTINMALKGILSKGQLAELVFPFPPIELQEQFATFVEQTDKSKLAVQKGLQELELLKKSLMQQYFG